MKAKCDRCGKEIQTWEHVELYHEANPDFNEDLILCDECGTDWHYYVTKWKRNKPY